MDYMGGEVASKEALLNLKMAVIMLEMLTPAKFWLWLQTCKECVTTYPPVVQMSHIPNRVWLSRSLCFNIIKIKK